MKITYLNCSNMDKEKLETQVFDWLESKDFNELSASEQSIVLTLMTAEEYQLQRRIMQEADQLSEAVIPGPLVIPVKTRVLPIWIASLSSAAAAAILVILFMPSTKGEINLEFASPTVVRDTLIVENTVTDTVVAYEVVRIPAASPKSNEITLTQIPEPMSSGANVPPIREDELVNAGVSAANDELVSTFRSKPFIGM